jgi:hypothetical protein
MSDHHEQDSMSDAKRRALNAQAMAEGTTPERIQQKRAQATSVQSVPGQKDAEGLVDGYATTEGEDYAVPQGAEREGYDPAHSGVRHAANKPGVPTQTPGRDEGTAWSSQEQMGSLRDTYDRKNPAQ